VSEASPPRIIALRKYLMGAMIASEMPYGQRAGNNNARESPANTVLFRITLRDVHELALELKAKYYEDE
jgi:hypothetical protein